MPAFQQPSGGVVIAARWPSCDLLGVSGDWEPMARALRLVPPEPEAWVRAWLGERLGLPEPGGEPAAAVLPGVPARVQVARPADDLVVVSFQLSATDGGILARLAESEQRYRRLLEAVPLGIVVHDGGRIVLANPTACRLVGASSQEELLGRSVLSFVHPEFQELARQRIRAVIEEGAPSQEMVHERFVRLDGSPLDVEVIAIQVEMGGRRLSQVVFRDITAQLAAEAERQALEERMHETQRLESLALLAGAVAHDLNNLLMGVMGNAELARLSVAEGSDVHRRLGRILVTSQEGARLARQMLDYSGRGAIHREPIDLTELVTGQRELLEAALADRAQLVVQVGGEVPPVLGDTVQLRQVVLNLVSNAADAGASRVAIGIRPGEGGEEAVLEVVDDGSGIRAHHVDRIFEPFFSTRRQGRGLGLAAVHGIVRGHGGRIDLETEPGRGTTFRIRFPAAEVVPEAARRPAASGGVRETAPHGRVLLVDQVPEVRAVTREMLEHLGFDVEACGSPEAALQVLASHPGGWRLVVLERSLPEPGYAEVLRRARRDQPHLPAIVVTGMDGSPDRPDLVARATWLGKPFTFGDLCGALQGALGASFLPPGARAGNGA